MAEVSPLRQRMIEDMTVRNLSPATQQSYIYAVAKFSRHCGRSPDRLRLEDVRAYQLHLIAQQRSWSHIKQVVCALRFCYGITLGRSDADEQNVAAREPQRLPVVLSGGEIMRFLEAVPGLRNRVAPSTAYGAGLRVGEVVHLTGPRPSRTWGCYGPPGRRNGRRDELAGRDGGDRVGWDRPRSRDWRWRGG